MVFRIVYDGVIAGLFGNLGALAACALAFMLYASLVRSPQWIESAFGRRDYLSHAFLGLIFGTTTACLIGFSTIIPTGSVVDLRAAPAILSGVFGGPIAVLITAVLGGLARGIVGGPWVLGGVASVMIYAVSGMVFGRLYNGLFGRVMDIPGLLFVALLATVAVIPSFFINTSWTQGAFLMKAVMPIILIKNPLGVLLLGASLLATLRIVQDRERLEALSLELASKNAADEISKRRLKETVDDLEQLIHTVSHDMRSPLITLRGFLGLMDEAKNRGDPAAYEHAKNRVSRSAQVLDSMVITALDHSRLASKVIVRERINAQTVFENIAEAVGLAAWHEEQDAKFIGRDATFYVDPEALQQVIQNAIENARKHSGRGNDLIIEAELDQITDQTLGLLDVISISDNGVVIPKASHSEAFRLFGRLSHDQEGSGIGPAIIEKIARLRGGRAWVTESHLGGTSLHVGFAAFPKNTSETITTKDLST